MIPEHRPSGFRSRPAGTARTLLFALGAALVALTPAHAQKPSPGPEALTYLTEDYAPSNYLEDGQLKGLAVELLKVLWKEMGVPEQPIQVINWARGFQMAESTPNTVLFAMTRKADREAKFLWVGPIYHSAFVLFSRTGRRVPLATLRDASAFRVGVLREDICEKFLLESGFPESHLERVAHVRQLIQMLEAGRIDLLCLPEESLQVYNLQQHADPGRFTREKVVFETVLYYAFNKATAPDLVARFQAALERVEPERRRIARKYFGTP